LAFARLVIHIFHKLALFFKVKHGQSARHDWKEAAEARKREKERQEQEIMEEKRRKQEEERLRRVSFETR